MRWDAVTRTLQVLAERQLADLKLPAAPSALKGISSGRDILFLDPSSCGPQDWLLVTEHLANRDDDLIAMNIIMACKQLPLRTAFIFHGSDVPTAEGPGPDRDAYEQYMQALLLADLLLPASSDAEKELETFFVQSQKAAFGPQISTTVAPQSDGGDATDQWHGYFRLLRGVLTDAADDARGIAALYYLVDDARERSSSDSPFLQMLASALSERAIKLIPAAWDPVRGRLVAAPSDLDAPLKTVCAWAAWIEPGQMGAPGWVLIPDPARARCLPDVKAFCKAHRLRSAAVLREPAEDFQPEHVRATFEGLALLDKVLVGSERQYREFYRFLLSRRDKTHSAEDRFKVVLAPSDQAGAELARPQPSWADYAKDVATELARDRPTDGLHPLAQRPGNTGRASDRRRQRPKLSLCISTYNRAGWLELSLRNIFSQLPQVRDDLEVLVVDNTSTDRTPKVARPYLSRPDFRYVRNKKNVGMLGNLAVTAQRARGEYVWILGDDDLTRPGLIERLLHLTDQNPDLGLIYLNYGYSNETQPQNITDVASFLESYNVLEPAGPDERAQVRQLAAKCENFFTAIYCVVFRRDHALRAYCQDTSGRIFSTMRSCIPTAYYTLNYMAEEPAYWIGEPSLVVNSNVSWQEYAALLDLEQLPRAWDLAERMGADPDKVDHRRAKRLWIVQLMWKEIFENDKAGNSAYFSAPRVLTRLKHLKEFDEYVAEFRAIYERAHASAHPAATLPPHELFAAFH